MRRRTFLGAAISVSAAQAFYTSVIEANTPTMPASELLCDEPASVEANDCWAHLVPVKAGFYWLYDLNTPDAGPIIVELQIVRDAFSHLIEIRNPSSMWHRLDKLDFVIDKLRWLPIIKPAKPNP